MEAITISIIEAAVKSEPPIKRVERTMEIVDKKISFLENENKKLIVLSKGEF